MWKKILSILFPEQCSISKKYGRYLDKKQQQKLTPHPEVCPVCHKVSQHFFTHIDCQNLSFLSGCIIGFCYDIRMKKLLYKLKYYRRYAIGEYIAEKLSFHISCHPFFSKFEDNDNMNMDQIFKLQKNKTIICSVPNHWYKKYFIRGYNQSEILAKHVSKFLGIPYVSLFVKTRKTQSQVGRTRQERQENVSNSFGLISDHQNILDTVKQIIIVDDIITTGATLEHIARVVALYHPHINVWGAVVARNGS